MKNHDFENKTFFVLKIFVLLVEWFALLTFKWLEFGFKSMNERIKLEKKKHKFS
jgi:hypothetical protein